MITLVSSITFLYGLALTLFATALSYSLAKWGFGNLYYLAQLLPTFMTLHVLVAWLLHLRKTGFLAASPKSRPPQVLGHYESPNTKDLPEDKVSGAELILVRDENGLVARRPMDPSPKRDGAWSFQKNLIPTLLWSALQIAILSIFLYRFYGIGSKFHL